MKLKWDVAGEHYYEAGVSNGVLYKMSTPGTYDSGVVWNGLTSVSESPEGAEATALYADNIKYLNLMSAEEFKCTIEAYTYPDEFAECDGSVEVADGLFIHEQDRKLFGLCYRTKIGNDQTAEAGYKIHIVYNCLAAPSEKSYETINDSPDAITFSWEVSTTPVEVTDHQPTTHLIIDSTKVTDQTKLQNLLDKLYGTDGSGSETGTEPTLLLPDAIIAILA